MTDLEIALNANAGHRSFGFFEPPRGASVRPECAEWLLIMARAAQDWDGVLKALEIELSSQKL